MTFRANLTPATMMSKWHALFSKVPEFEKGILKPVTSLPNVKFFYLSCIRAKHTFQSKVTTKIIPPLVLNSSRELFVKAIKQLHTLLLTISPGSRSVISRMEVSRTRHLGFAFALDLSRIEHMLHHVEKEKDVISWIEVTKTYYSGTFTAGDLEMHVWEHGRNTRE